MKKGQKGSKSGYAEMVILGVILGGFAEGKNGQKGPFGEKAGV